MRALHGLQLAQQRGLTLVHPYDDLGVMAGQGTIALEMLAAQPDIDTLVVAVGGGGLISGMATAARALRPGIQVFGVQTERFPPVWNARARRAARMRPGHHRRRHRRQVARRADAAADPRARRRRAAGQRGRHRAGASCCCWRSRRRWSKARARVGLAALLKHRERFAGRKVGLVLCGGNIEPLVLAEIIQRGMVKSGRLVRLRFDVRDVPGSLADVAAPLGRLGANIDEVQHQRAFTTLSVERAQIEVVVQTRGAAHVEQIIDSLRVLDYRVERVD